MTRTSQCLSCPDDVMSFSLSSARSDIAIAGEHASPMDATMQLLHNSTGSYRGEGMGAAVTGDIPHYYLYGDQGADVELDFLNIEAIRDRSGPPDWSIRPHAHPDHLPLLLVREGGGTIRMEDRTLPIPAPGVLVVPAGIVHQIDFRSEERRVGKEWVRTGRSGWT